jgi:hypothetical protein
VLRVCAARASCTQYGRCEGHDNVPVTMQGLTSHGIMSKHCELLSLSLRCCNARHDACCVSVIAHLTQNAT